MSPPLFNASQVRTDSMASMVATHVRKELQAAAERQAAEDEG